MVISKSVIGNNSEKIGLETIIRGQLWVVSARFLPNQGQTEEFEITIGNTYGEEYLVKINGLTGKYIEGSREKIK